MKGTPQGTMATLSKKARKRVAKGCGSRAEIVAALGTDACATVEDCTHEAFDVHQWGVHLKDVHAFLEHLLVPEAQLCPRFVGVQHRALVRQVVVLIDESPGGAVAQAADQLRQSSVSSMATWLRVPTTPVGVRPRGPRALMFVKGEAVGGKAPQPAHSHVEELLVTEDAMLEEGYPGACRVGAQTVLAPAAAERRPRGRLRGLDCEMVRVASGALALARASVVDEDGAVLLDTLVKPAERVVDHLTQFSGIEPGSLSTVATSTDDARRMVLDLLEPGDILVGHSLECDLTALGLAWRRCIDTSLLFPHPLGGGRKRKLASLAKELLGVRIQAHTPGGSGPEGAAHVRKQGHCSVEDARAALRLVKRRLVDRHFGSREPLPFDTVPEAIARKLPAEHLRWAVLDLDQPATREAAAARARQVLQGPGGAALLWCGAKDWRPEDVSACLAAVERGAVVIAVSPAAPNDLASSQARAPGRGSAGPRAGHGDALALVTVAVCAGSGLGQHSRPATPGPGPSPARE